LIEIQPIELMTQKFVHLKEKQRAIKEGSKHVVDQHVKELYHQLSDMQAKSVSS